MATHYLFKYLREHFLNAHIIRPKVHHCVNVPTLLGKLPNLESNALVIGHNHAWLILCATASSRFTIGT